ncbi:hypothetical protein DRN67_01195 [Candidatus Micrarchaeota archaeon]|nr:MAG: hypothetical protein DRN67_01195 [Candidatus Micrarchaeota archaeon]
MKFAELFPLTDQNLISILKIDHRASLARSIRPSKPKSISASRLFSVKNDVVKALSPFSSATLIDHNAAKKCKSRRTLSKKDTLIFPLERTGFSQTAGERLNLLEKGWTPKKAKRAGATAVKLLLYYNPRYQRSASRQTSLLKKASSLCKKAGIPLMLELVIYEISLDMWEGAILNSAREFSPHCDLIALQFPSTSIEMASAIRACERISDSLSIPWVLHGDREDFAQFKWKLEAACLGGASGFSAGSAVWKEAVRLSASERLHFLNVISAGRLIRLRDIVRKYGRRVDEFA